MKPARTWRTGLAALALAWAAAAVAAGTTYYRFDNPRQQARYDRLTEELRCLVCQGESIADSHADLAKDLRDQVHEMVAAGKTDRQVIDFMVDRYGDFILYRPPVEPATWLLWGGPFLLLCLAAAVALVRARRSRQEPARALDGEERRRLSAALSRHHGGQGRS